MGDILSQSEIDNLLNAINSGADSQTILTAGNNVKEAKNYNFKRPSKFNKEQLRTLEIIFDNYARIISSFLSAYLRTATTIEVATAEQLTYGEFNNSLVNPVILSIVELSPLKGSVMIDLSANLGFSIIDRILGGPGFGISRVREFSDIEIILLERIMTQLTGFLQEPWENVCKIKPTHEKIETNSQFAQIISNNEMIALVTLSAKIGSVEGFINFCIPHVVIEPIMKRLNTKYWFSKSNEEEHNNTYRDELTSKLETTKAPIVAVIGKTYITIDDFLQLQVGDIMPLDTFINSDLTVFVGSLPKFKGKPGINRGKNAIQITAHIGKED